MRSQNPRIQNEIANQARNVWFKCGWDCGFAQGQVETLSGLFNLLDGLRDHDSGYTFTSTRIHITENAALSFLGVEQETESYGLQLQKEGAEIIGDASKIQHWQFSFALSVIKDKSNMSADRLYFIDNNIVWLYVHQYSPEVVSYNISKYIDFVQSSKSDYFEFLSVGKDRFSDCDIPDNVLTIIV